jgi:hypothetical protein
MFSSCVWVECRMCPTCIAMTLFRSCSSDSSSRSMGMSRSGTAFPFRIHLTLIREVMALSEANRAPLLFPLSMPISIQLFDCGDAAQYCTTSTRWTCSMCKEEAQLALLISSACRLRTDILWVRIKLCMKSHAPRKPFSANIALSLNSISFRKNPSEICGAGLKRNLTSKK